MNIRFIISVVVLFVWTMLVGIVIHSYLLGADYAALPNLFRPQEDMQNYMSYMLVAHLCVAIGLTWIYRMGKEDKPWLAQGIRFGIALVFLMTFSKYLIYFAVQPMPAELVHN
ncbi:MAG: hypothetical protein EXR85_08975, partial [Xanthomonadales bacterium]|nr:hypothetical protein [Xanthomonadales bacterium]